MLCGLLILPRGQPGEVALLEEGLGDVDGGVVPAEDGQGFGQVAGGLAVSVLPPQTTGEGEQAAGLGNFVATGGEGFVAVGG